MLTTTRRGISYPNPDRSDRADIALHIGNVATAADADVIFNQGTDAARLAAGHQTGGGRFWYATDTSLLWYDDGTTWRSVAPTSNTAGLLSARPAANAVTPGSHFFATDQVVEYISDGSAWLRPGMPAGGTVDWYEPDAAVPAGWVLYDGSNLPASTGIYADLYAHLGSSLTKPDTRGRASYGVGTNADVSAVGTNDGLAAASRSPKHNQTNGLALPNHGHAVGDGGHSHGVNDPTHYHAINDPTHAHNSYHVPGANQGVNWLHGGWEGDDVEGTIAPAVHGAATGIGIYGAYTGIGINGAATGVTVGNPTSNPAINGTIGPGGSRPTDSGGYIACAKIGKL